MSYVVYILRCSDGTLYTGVSTDVERRVAEHNGLTKGAKYTKARQPVVLVYQEPSASRSEAQKREYELRTLTRAEKIKLLKS